MEVLLRDLVEDAEAGEAAIVAILEDGSLLADDRSMAIMRSEAVMASETNAHNRGAQCFVCWRLERDNDRGVRAVPYIEVTPWVVAPDLPEHDARLDPEPGF